MWKTGAVRLWAKSLFILSVFSSTVLLLVPKSMQKQCRFVAEMLILLCVVAPLGGLLRSGRDAAVLSASPGSGYGEQSSLGRFYSEETARRITEIGRSAGLLVESVKVTTGDSGFSLVEVVVCLGGGPGDEVVRAYRETVRAYLGIQDGRLKVTVHGTGAGTGT